MGKPGNSRGLPDTEDNLDVIFVLNAFRCSEAADAQSDHGDDEGHHRKGEERAVARLRGWDFAVLG